MCKYNSIIANFFPFKVAPNFAITYKGKNLEFVVCVAIEGMRVNCGSILVEAIALWKNSMKFKWLSCHPKEYIFQDI